MSFTLFSMFLACTLFLNAIVIINERFLRSIGFDRPAADAPHTATNRILVLLYGDAKTVLIGPLIAINTMLMMLLLLFWFTLIIDPSCNCCCCYPLWLPIQPLTSLLLPPPRRLIPKCVRSWSINGNNGLPALLSSRSLEPLEWAKDLRIVLGWSLIFLAIPTVDWIIYAGLCLI